MADFRTLYHAADDGALQFVPTPSFEFNEPDVNDRFIDLEGLDAGRAMAVRNGTYLDPGPGVPTSYVGGAVVVMDPSGALQSFETGGNAHGAWHSPRADNVWIPTTAGSGGNSGLRSGPLKRFDGSSLQTVEAPGSQPYGPNVGYSVSPNHALVQTGFGYSLQHWELCNGAWTSIETSIQARAMWGSAPDNYYAVGASEGAATVARWDGAAWTTAFSGPPGTFATIWGSGAGDIWVGGGPGGLLYHYDGVRWDHVDLASVVEIGDGVWTIRGSGPHDVVIAGHGFLAHWDGTSMSSLIDRGVAPGESWAQVWGAGNEVLVRSAAGVVLGTTLVPGQLEIWSLQSICSGCTITAIGGSTSGAWAAAQANVSGQISLYKRTNGTWNADSFSPPSPVVAFIESAGSVWALAGNTIYQHDGSGWSAAITMPIVPIVSQYRRGFWTDGNDAWVIDSQNGDALHWNGSAWTTFTDETYLDVVGRTSGEVYFLLSTVSNAGRRWNGTSMESYATPVGAYYLGGNATHLWATAYRRMWIDDGQGFQEVTVVPEAPHLVDAYFNGTSGQLGPGIVVGSQAILSHRP